MAEGWLVDGVPLETARRTVDTRTGWDDLPGARGDDVTLLGRHGQRWRPKRHDRSRRTLAITLHGLDDAGRVPASAAARRAVIERELDDLARLLLVRHRPLLVERVHADGARRRALCDVTGALTPEHVTDDTARVVVELQVPGGLWEDVDATSLRLPLVTTGDVQDVELWSLRGQTGPCPDAVVAVTGPCSSLTIVDAPSGTSLAWPVPVPDGSTLVVDLGATSALLDGVESVTTLTALDLEVSPAPTADRGPRLQVTCPGAGGGTRVVVTARRRWLR